MAINGFIPIVLLLAFTEQIYADDKCAQDIKDMGCVPKYADTVKSTNLQVEYMGKNVSCGDIVNLLQAFNPPKLYYNPPGCCRNITVLAFLPKPIQNPPFMSWLILNVPPDNLRNGFTTPLIGNTDNNGYYAGNYVTPKNPGAYTETIVYFVYCQCVEITDKTMYLEPFRGGFDIKGYAKKNRLGSPMAACYHKFTDSGIDTSKLVTDTVPDAGIDTSKLVTFTIPDAGIDTSKLVTGTIPDAGIDTSKLVTGTVTDAGTDTTNSVTDTVSYITDGTDITDFVTVTIPPLM